MTITLAINTTLDILVRVCKRHDVGPILNDEKKSDDVSGIDIVGFA